MKQLTITIPSVKKQSYPIFIGKDLLKKISNLFDFSKYSRIFVITDKTIAPLYLEKLLKALPKEAITVVIPTGENTKNLTTVSTVWQAMIDANLDRKSVAINLGGGVIGDLGGFAASTFMRGIDFINIPTTLLAQVDESVGGKTGIDFAKMKNNIGTFNQPRCVVIDIQTLKTLPQRHLVSGFVEIIKYGLITDKVYFKKVTSKKPINFTDEELLKIITRACEIKAKVIEKDEKESDLRKIVNCGHTIGHAVEMLSLETDKPLLHGEAVSIGIVAEATLANGIGILSKKDLTIIKETLKNADAPVSLPDFSADKIISNMKSDKKNTGGKINFTLLKRIGEGIINQTVHEEVIKQILENI